MAMLGNRTMEFTFTLKYQLADDGWAMDAGQRCERRPTFTWSGFQRVGSFSWVSVLGPDRPYGRGRPRPWLMGRASA